MKFLNCSTINTLVRMYCLVIVCYVDIQISCDVSQMYCMVTMIQWFVWTCMTNTTIFESSSTSASTVMSTLITNWANTNTQIHKYIHTDKTQHRAGVVNAKTTLSAIEDCLAFMQAQYIVTTAKSQKVHISMQVIAKAWLFV